MCKEILRAQTDAYKAAVSSKTELLKRGMDNHSSTGGAGIETSLDIYPGILLTK
uniref:Uncharacterized protein n=1 Tax=Candidatus Nitrotoga fabula TaxID=2182327 RepID=A0A2X0SIH3_9PROT|nr:protein of unknown function [Candidatus Nitrotoga fabula]